jgi:hypothetical protein
MVHPLRYAPLVVGYGGHGGSTEPVTSIAIPEGWTAGPPRYVLREDVPGKLAECRRHL